METSKMSDWEYRCINCGKVVTTGADFAGSCPECHGARWCCHWLSKDHNSEESGGEITPGRILTPKTELLPLNRNGNSTPGPKIPAIPNGLIKELAGQGLGVKAIATKLAEQGIVVSHMTIQRRLQSAFL